MFKQRQTTDEKTVTVTINGTTLAVPVGTSVAALALTQDMRYTRSTAISASKRAPFCMMGVCYDCLMVINGKTNQRACTVLVKQDMQIERQTGLGSQLGDPL